MSRVFPKQQHGGSKKLKTTRMPILFLGSLFSASLTRRNRDPGCGWSRDHLTIQSRRVDGYSSTFGREENPVAPSFQQIFPPPRFWVVTQPATTRVSVPKTKGGREERPCERGCSHASYITRDTNTIRHTQVCKRAQW